MRPEEPKTTRELAPVAVFAYDRPDHLKRCIEALRRNALAPFSDLYVFSDAARGTAHARNVDDVRTYIGRIDGFKTVTITKRDCNIGLAASIVDGVSRLAREYGKVIVVEDDLVVAPHFLQFLNDGLDFYAADDRVAGIHGYTFPVGRPLPETFFLRDPGCWGWATWKRAWDLFESDGGKLRREIERRGLRHAFNYDGQYDYSGMLDEQIAGRNSSWAVRWCASVFLNDKLVLYPGVSLVRNIGKDGSGTHDAASNRFDVTLGLAPIEVKHIPVEESAVAREAMVTYLGELRRLTQPSFPRRAVSRLRQAIARRLVS